MRGVIETNHAVRLGFRQIKGLSKERMEAFVERRGAGYATVRDVWLRSGLDVDEIERLAQADAFRSLGLDRREALWAVRALDGKSAAEKLPLFDQPAIRLRELEPETKLPTMPLGEHVIHDYRSLGLSLKAQFSRASAGSVIAIERSARVFNAARLEQRLFFHSSVQHHHRHVTSMAFFRRRLTLPVGLQIVGLRIGAERLGSDGCRPSPPTLSSSRSVRRSSALAKQRLARLHAQLRTAFAAAGSGRGRRHFSAAVDAPRRSRLHLLRLAVVAQGAHGGWAR